MTPKLPAQSRYKRVIVFALPHKVLHTGLQLAELALEDAVAGLQRVPLPFRLGRLPAELLSLLLQPLELLAALLRGLRYGSGFLLADLVGPAPRRWPLRHLGLQAGLPVLLQREASRPLQLLPEVPDLSLQLGDLCSAAFPLHVGRVVRHGHGLLQRIFRTQLLQQHLPLPLQLRSKVLGLVPHLLQLVGGAEVLLFPVLCTFPEHDVRILRYELLGLLPGLLAGLLQLSLQL
mmetsp:Transcript_66824/g.215407  ORF Transcript_66824/g.215407 Transcript_66824/m.215407 type:complete len:233 (-) Transcript_66824:455-1153(-)